MNVFGFFECEYCDQRFLKEPAFKKHRCETMKRHEFHKTVTGKAAFRAYSTWFRVRGVRVPAVEYFFTSKFYKAFVNVAKFCQKTMIPDMKGYIDLCTNDLQLLPNFWCRGDVYEKYIAEFDERYSPLDQAKITLQTLDTYARSLNCEVDDLLTRYLTVNDIIWLIQSKKVSLWVLLNWDRFIQFLEKVDRDEWTVLKAVVNMDHWIQKFNKQPKTTAKIKKLVKEFGI